MQRTDHTNISRQHIISNYNIVCKNDVTIELKKLLFTVLLKEWNYHLNFYSKEVKWENENAMLAQCYLTSITTNQPHAGERQGKGILGPTRFYYCQAFIEWGAKVRHLVLP